MTKRATTWGTNMTILVRFLEDVARIYDNIQEITSTRIDEYILYESNGNVTILPKCNIESIHVDANEADINEPSAIYRGKVS